MQRHWRRGCRRSSREARQRSRRPSRRRSTGCAPRQRSGGRALFPADLRELPAIVAGEAVRSAGGATVTEPFTVRAANHAIAAGISTTALPQLRGYVVTALKPRAEPVLTSHLGDPLL